VSTTLTDEPPETGVTRTAAARVTARAAAELERHLAQPLALGLYVVATPIGNLGDMTLRGIATLARSDVIYAEDTRHSRILLSHYGIGQRSLPYHEHNAERTRPAIVEGLRLGKRIALVSDAGTPLISDPGYKLVRDVLAAGYEVVALPGPSAVLAALVSAGLPTNAFPFAGFLPAKAGQRRSRIAELKDVAATLVLFESASRLSATLSELADILGARQGVVARELTKLHEEVRRGALADLAQWALASPAKGEMVIVVGPAPDGEPVSDDVLRDEIAGLLATMSVRDAARVVADRVGVPRGRVYDIALAVKNRIDR
jgi:16S rRNA (cytidine1402-2'-O)-methyltransferase